MAQQEKIVLFSGTTEGREYSEKLTEDKIYHIVCVATDYGKEVMKPSPYADVRVGRLNADEMAELFISEQITKVIDVTHPYAVEVTKNIRTAVEKVASLANNQTEQEIGVEDNISQNGISYERITRKIESIDKLRFTTELKAQGENRMLEQNADEEEKLKQNKNYINIQENTKQDTRNTDTVQVEERVVYYTDMAEAVNFLQKTDGNILLTTGSKELKQFATTDELRKRLYARVLPAMESLEICVSCGIERSHVIAMQGPFSVGMNAEILRQYNIRWLVTKNTGKVGGFPEKLCAAELVGCGCVVIDLHDKKETGYDDWQKNAKQGLAGCDKASEGEKLSNKTDGGNINQQKKKEPFLKITLCGIGAGDESEMTVAVHRIIQSADVLFGAARVLGGRSGRLDTKAIYRPEDILSYIKNFVKKNNSGYKYQLVILFSGDTGFYSGCDSVYRALCEELVRGEFKGSIQILPGVSSVSMLSAKIGVPYQNAVLFSIHGKQRRDWSKELADILSTGIGENQSGQHSIEASPQKIISQNKKIFILLSNAENLVEIKQILLGSRQGNAEIYIGYNLFLEDEAVVRTTARELQPEKFRKGLFTICILPKLEIANANGNAVNDKVTQTSFAPEAEGCFAIDRMPIIQFQDTDFLRKPRLPMTKQEIRSIIFAKLELTKNAVFYDIGSGTGSIAVTAAASQGLLTDAANLQVLAFERKEEACNLIRENANRLNAVNLNIFNGEAPDIFNEIPANIAVPTHAFIGGSGGRMEDIYYALIKQNPSVRIVITAITMETVQACYQLRKKYGLNDMEVLQVYVARERTLGRYHSTGRGNDVYVFVLN